MKFSYRLEIHTEVMGVVQKTHGVLQQPKHFFQRPPSCNKKKKGSTHLTTWLLVKPAVNLESQGCTEMDI